MDEQRFLDLAARYVAGSASAEEIELLKGLLTEQRYAELFRKVNDVWLLGGKQTPVQEFPTDRGLDRLAEKLRKHEPLVRWGPNRRRFPQPSYRSAYIAMAASIATVLMIIGIQLYEANKADRRASLAWNVKTTRMGEKIVLSLPEGSTITLNADSKLRYPAQFADGSRDVYLEGEAYFDVKHDATRAFIVHTGGMTTLDLGTKFNISAFPADSTITMSLIEGKVEVRAPRSGAAAEGVVLSSSGQFTYNKTSGTAAVGRCDPRTITGWKDNLYVFDNKPLGTVCMVMERAFGVKFELADSSLAFRLIKAEFRNETVWTVAEILKKATGIPYHAVYADNTLKKIILSKN